MADETTEGQTSGETTSTVATPDNTQQTSTQTPTSTQVAVPANNGWEAEKRAFIADLQKERKAAQQYRTQAETHRTELDLERRRIQALTGVVPKSAQDTEADEVRARFKQVVPRAQLLEMLDLTEDDIKSLKGVGTHQQQLAKLETQHWDNHGEKMMGALQKEVLAVTGGDKLTTRQERSLVSTFVQACNDDPELKARYERGDVTVFKEFTQEWSEDWLKPAQRRAQAADLSRNRPVPQGRDRSVTTTAGKKIDVNDNKAVEDLLEQGFRDRGGRFKNE